MNGSWIGIYYGDGEGMLVEYTPGSLLTIIAWYALLDSCVMIKYDKLLLPL